MAVPVASKATAMTARPQKSVPVIASMFSSSTRAQDVADGLGVPASPTRRGHTPRIECLSNLPQRRRISFLRLSDDGEHIGRVPIGFRHDGRLCVPAGHVELWAAQGHPMSFGLQNLNAD
jgi:hypothetical protein